MSRLGSQTSTPARDRAQRWAAAWCRIARRPGRAVTAVVAASLVTAIVTTSIAGIPEPEVHDELTMLVMADIFANGRLCEPTHPLWQHFEANYLLSTPCTQGKYPPGLPLYMALGRILTGEFIGGVWIAVAVMIASAGYAMYSVLPPRWALLGTLLVALRFGIAGDWAVSYWGGSVAAAGGALVFGAVVRLPIAPVVRDGALLGAGLVMLAMSRPYEGLMLSIPALIVLAVRIVRRQQGFQHLLGALAASAAVAVGGLGWLAYYNARVTGSVVLLPYTSYERTHTSTPLFVFQDFRAMPVIRNAQMAGIEDYLVYEATRSRTNWPGHKLANLAASLWDFVKPSLWLAVAGLYGLRRWRSTVTLAWLSAAAIGAGVLLTSPATAQRYLAPATVSIFFLGTAGLAGLWRRQFGPIHGRVVIAGILVTTVAAVTTAAAAHVYDTRTSREWWASKRDIREQLLATAGDDLVFVRYGTGHNPHQEWVFNGAGLDARPVVWARALSPDADARLRAYYKDRKAWVVLADANPPRIAPWQDDETR